MFTVMDYQSQTSELKPTSASKVENQFNNLMFKRWWERRESVHILQYQLNQAYSGALWRGTVCAAVAVGAERDLPACSHRGEEHDRRTLLEVMVIDWIVSAPLLFSDQCPTICHFLSARLFLLPLTRPVSYLTLPVVLYSLCSAACCLILALSPFPFHCWPFITQDLLKANRRNLNGLLDSSD